MATKRTIDQPVVSTAAGAAAAPARRQSNTTKRTPRAVGAETSKEVAVTESRTEAITEESIARLAYALWESRGCQGGSPEEDWLEAERQLRAASK